MTARITVATSVVGADADELWPVYDMVFGDQPDASTWRSAVWDRHTGRPGFRLARAYDEDILVGFAYGYTGEAGQWWTDHAREVLDRDAADEWLGGHFEVVTLGVLATARRRGTGRALMAALLDDLPHDRMLLMTSADPDDPARRLYESTGWRVLGPGIGNETAILGRRRPGSVGGQSSR